MNSPGAGPRKSRGALATRKRLALSDVSSFHISAVSTNDSSFATQRILAPYHNVLRTLDLALRSALMETVSGLAHAWQDD